MVNMEKQYAIRGDKIYRGDSVYGEIEYIIIGNEVYRYGYESKENRSIQL